ncbi:MAG: hypothetical protein HUK02_08165 [Bacteroidaceae bacterium]|nr:hypothetical protein [Bacteroidaceae bacterium]MCF0199283.1 hypothetical protein [Bacteroidaceae bacterium]
MTHLTELYNHLDPMMRFYWTVALVTSLVFVIQFILTFVGIGDTDSDFDFQSDVDASAGDTLDTGGAMQLFTVRNFINFLLGLGWGGVCFSSITQNHLLLALLALATGAVFVAIFVAIFKQAKRLESNGAYQIKDCVGQVCDVYLRIPANRSGQGKVQVSFGGSVQELAAATNGDAIASGTKVYITSLLDDHTVLVEKA